MSACISRRFLAENQAFSELCGQGLPTNSAEEAFFLKPTGTYPAWWDVNWDLLTVVAAAYYKQTLRGEGITDVLSHFNDFKDHDHFFLDLKEYGQQGIPTMFVIVRDLKLPPEETISPKLSLS